MFAKSISRVPLRRLAPTFPRSCFTGVTKDLQREFMNDLPTQTDDMFESGSYSASYSFSSSSLMGADGQRRKFTKQEYKDSSGRVKAAIRRDLGEMSWIQETRGGDVTVKLNGLSQAEVPDFEQRWRGKPVESQASLDSQGKLRKRWGSAWDLKMKELANIGFSDRELATTALIEANGDLQKAVRMLVAADRQVP
eukprot:TRINITY_DN6219_c0_g1_i1.p1 TRINITY_DN6219_c0_g1~~TRINITY_DN6219_c0_g1_i1.p1  ORF type:complete len:195 (-),score=43.73 TRINITY_DN6219_c0_g1_i1:221-805(-)